jgi:dTDP-4-dehydrorhamnose 3,5-epimerase
MPYSVESTALNEVLLLKPKVFSDPRGFFFESFNQREFEKATGLSPAFVQDNHSLSQHGVLRGLHFQKQFPQGKLIRAVRGEIFDVAVDIRPDSAQYGQWTGVRLSGDNHHQLWIPAGFAHGFLVLSEQAEVIYKTTDYWVAQDEDAIMWNDADIGIEWPLNMIQGAPQLSGKDAAARAFKPQI